MDTKGHRGFDHLIRAAGWSWAGLKAAWRHEAAFRQECFLALFLVPLALWLGATGPERAILLGSLGIVLIVELLNSAIEAVVDLCSPKHHELAGRAKDLGSAAVFVTLFFGIAAWGVVLWPG
ncbi:MAG: diacylglycerol kinase [Magnetococcales bacterium]|nr:diacylglycerol kinase [Magnetococcales bacterium]MBF0155896.1 diacylglycerol kinase [Magnetococcales bacterium]